MANKSEKRGFVKGTALGVTVGALAGAVVGVLFAPQSGKETRTQIVRALHKGQNELGRIIAQTQAQLAELTEVAGKDAAELITRAQQLQKEMKHYAKLMMSKSKDVSEDARVEAKRLIDEGQKIAEDLRRIVAKRAPQAKKLATATKDDVVKSVKKNAKPKPKK